MALTKANSDVIDIPSVSTSLSVETTPAGIKKYIDDVGLVKAPINNPTLTGTVNVPTALANDNSTKAANTAHVAANSYGLDSKSTGSGPKIFVSTGGPSGGNPGDIWLQYI